MTEKKVKIKTPFIKLDQLLKYADICSSGGEASYFISEGFVSIDGVTEMQRGKKIRPGMSVKCKVPGKNEIVITVDPQEGQ